MITSNQILIETLIKEGHLKSRRIIDAFLKIDRVNFVPDKFKKDAYVNEPLPIGFGQMISKPAAVAFILELLEPQPGDRVLEIGAGSGWKTAILAHIIAGSGRVVAIERIEQIQKMAVENVSKFGFVDTGAVTILHADGSLGNPAKAPFDKIISGAAVNSVPQAWKDQVRVGGRIVIPIEDTIKVLKKTSPIDFEVKEYFGFKFIPMVTGAGGS